MGAARKLAYRVAVPDENGDMQWYGPEDTIPAAVATKITNPSAWASSDDSVDDDDSGSGDDGSDSGPSYSSMKKADLEVEVARRNEGRDEDDVIEVEGNGTKADLVAALEADDAANAGA